MTTRHPRNEKALAMLEHKTHPYVSLRLSGRKTCANESRKRAPPKISTIMKSGNARPLYDADRRLSVSWVP